MLNRHIFEYGEVISNVDSDECNRIKVRLEGNYDNIYSDDNLPTCFPLMPKMVNIVPKVGECVIVFCQDPSFHGERFYIGPVISQPQKMYHDPYLKAKSGLHSGLLRTSKPLSLDPKAKSSYPGVNEIAIVGRKSSDLIVKDDEVLLRAGKLMNGSSSEFNKSSVGYVQTKYYPATEKSSVNIVGNYVNLLSHNSSTVFDVSNQDELISSQILEKIIEKAHRLPYGDDLIEFLKLFINAFMSHTHPTGGAPPVPDNNMLQLQQKSTDTELDKLLSKSIRIN